MSAKLCAMTARLVVNFIRVEKLLGMLLMTAGVFSLAFGIFSIARLMNIFIPRMEEATISQLASFFYASTPQAILWSIAFATFFASGILMGKASLSESSEQAFSKMLKSRVRLTEGMSVDGEEPPRNEVDERIQAIKNEVLRAIQRLEKLDRLEERTKDS